MRKRHHRAVKGSGRSIPFVLICIFGGAPTEIAAQEPLVSGSRVRVTSDSHARSVAHAVKLQLMVCIRTAGKEN